MEQLHSVLGARIEHSDGLKSIKDPPGVLALCTGAPWFPPLAVTAPTKNIPVVAAPPPEKVQVIYKPFQFHYFTVKLINCLLNRLFLTIRWTYISVYFRRLRGR